MLLGLQVSMALFYVQLETNGDQWHDYADLDAAPRYFWYYFYFGIVLLSTIGFGDIYPVTDLGIIFFVIYVLVCLVR